MLNCKQIDNFRRCCRKDILFGLKSIKMSWDINKICRTCLAGSGPMISIFKGSSVTPSSPCLAEMLNFFTEIHLKPDSQMPESVCLPCISEINRCYTFKIKCESSNNALLQLLNDSNETEEIISDTPKRKIKKFITHDKDKYNREAIRYSVKELDPQLEEMVQEPEEFMQETEDLVHESEDIAPKIEEIFDPLEENAEYTVLTSKDDQNIGLINAVKKHPCLYNRFYNRRYKNNPKRSRAWHKISRAVNLPEKTCQSRWKVIRDQYVRIIKETYTSSEEKTNCRFKKSSSWPLLKYLEFLSDHVSWKVAEDVSEHESTLHCPSRREGIELVHEVRKYLCLYDKNSSGYTNSSLRLKAWHEISTKMNLPVKLCQERWRSIRDRYVRICKSAARSGGRAIDSPWHMLKHVQFLKDHFCPKRSPRPAEIPSDCEPIEVDVTEITYDNDSMDINNFKPEQNENNTIF